MSNGGFGNSPYSSSPLSAGYETPQNEWVPYVPPSLVTDPLRQTPGYGASPYGTSPSGGGEDYPPYIGNWEPFVGAEVGRMDTIEFDVLDDYGIDETRVTAIFPAGIVEEVFTEDGGFADLYERGSGRRTLDDGYRYILRRRGGWPSASVRISVVATDIADNVSTSQASF